MARADRDHARRSRCSGCFARGLDRVAVAAGRAGRRRACAKLAMVALFVVIVVSFSPTMTAAVISETGARGPLSDLVLAIVVLADLVVLVLFSLAMQLARALVRRQAGDDDVNVLVRLAWEIGGAIAFGSLVGALFALYLRYVAREVTLVLLGVCVLLSQVGTDASAFEPLLAAMAAGMVIAERRRAAGRRAQGRDSARRAAGARRVLRRDRHVAAARRARCRSGSCRARRSLVARIALIRLGVARRAARVRASIERAGRVRLDRTDLAGRHHARAGVGARDRVSDLGQPGADAARRADRHRRAVGPAAVPHRPGARGRDRRQRAASAASSCRTASRTCTTTTSEGRITVRAGDRRRRRRARRADARARRRLDRARRRAPPIARSSTPATRCACRPSSPSYRAAPALARSEEFARVLRRIRERRAVAALPSGRRAAEVPQRGLGGVSGGQRPVRRGDRRGAADAPTRRSSSRTITSRSWRRGCASGGRRPARRCSGTSRGRIRIGCASVRGGARSSPGCWPTICWRFSSNAIAATSCCAVEDELDAEIEADGARIRFDGRVTHRRLRCRSASTTIGFRRSAAITALVAEQERLTAAVRSRRRASSASASIGSTTRRAFPNGSRRSTACSRGVPSCAAG